MIRALLLCGGRSSRFGSDKLLAGSEPLALQSARALRAGAGSVLAVMPLERPDLRRILEAAGCEILETDRTRRGLGASLAAGVEASSSSSGWIVALGDMPRVKATTIASVKSALEKGATIAAPFHGGKRGHPVGFSAALRNELIALDGDVGARSILERHASDVTHVDVDDTGIFIDVDTPEDLQNL